MEPTVVKPIVVFVLGGPGSGKGTQCTKIQQKYKFKHLSAGDLLRQQRKSGSENGQLIQKLIKEGKIVPSEITINLLKKAISLSKDYTRFLIDGFPRNKQNQDGWQTIMGQLVYTPFILQFECPEDILVDRLLERGKTSGRSDDNAQSIKKRLHTYNNDTLPIVQYYQSIDKCKIIKGNEPIQEVFSIICGHFDKLIDSL